MNNRKASSSTTTTTTTTSIKREHNAVDDEEVNCPNKKSKSHWTQGLKQALANRNNVILETDLVSVIHDKYPKAKYHFLVIVKQEDLSSVKSLNSSHVGLLKHMLEVADEIKKSITTTDQNVRFKEGFHAVPSMTLMHMHVISLDFDSTYVKHKRHWNSFNTEFFRSAQSVLKVLEEEGKVAVDTYYYKQFLMTPLQCHLCDAKPKNMPRLKDHVKTHFKHPSLMEAKSSLFESTGNDVPSSVPNL